MAFRIRCTDYENEEYWKTKDKVYREHLAKFNKHNNSDLWKYFYWDFFHDGLIEKIVFWENPGDVVFHTCCPNIKRKRGEKYEYINVDFTCTFRDVVYFHINHERSEELVYEQQSPFIYIASEINTLSDILKKKMIVDEDGETEFYSLIIEVLGAETSFEIEIVFTQVDVVAKENTAFELMLASDNFYVPIYREDEDIDKLPEWISNPSCTKYIPDEDEDS